MSAEPLLPINEKQPVEDTLVHPESTGLRLGGERQSLRKRFQGLSTIRKVLLVGAFAWLVTGSLHSLTRSFARHHHRHYRFGLHKGCNKHAAWEDVEPTLTVATYATSMDFYDGTEVYQTANATLPLVGGELSVAFTGEGAGEHLVVVSRADVEVAEIVVESVWAGEAVEGVEMSSTPYADNLSVKSNDDARHIIHLVLPTSAESIPSLALWSPSTLNLFIHPSATDLPFDALSVSADGQIELPAVAHIDDLSIETKTGAISGSFNVTKALVLRTVTGDITASVHVKPLFPPHGPNGTHPHPPPPHKHAQEGEDDFEEEEEVEEEEEEDNEVRWEKRGKRGHKHHSKKSYKAKKRHHAKRQSEEKGAAWFPFSLFGSRQDKEHRRHNKGPQGPPPPPHGEHPPPPPHGKAPPPPPHGEYPPPPPHGEHPPPPHGERPPPPPHDKAPPPHGHPHHPPHGPPHPHPPPPVFIGAFSTTGTINLTIHAPPFVSSDVKAFSRTGGVAVKYPTFKGFFEAGSLVGSVSVEAPHKETKILKEYKGETAEFVKGLVFPIRKNLTSAEEGVDADWEELIQM
ncbi:hypothetical protein BCR39DRAFT_257324 [Naematelia encephala]|uniref:Adhesin domain-containing protein n=1 Tax=Naematelia encephala TaxID=71784 RepID=A0A1Y2AVD4_9TREE|nr:hypothetical protein BCR39DRAFT_257324 [Naematelia encephala]